MQQVQNRSLECQWILSFGKELDSHALSIDQVLEKVVLNMFVGQVLLQQIVEWMMGQVFGASQNGKSRLWILLGPKLGDGFIAAQFLMKLIRRYSHNVKALRVQVLVQMRQFLKLQGRLASLTGRIDNHGHLANKLTKIQRLAINIGQLQPINGGFR